MRHLSILIALIANTANAWTFTPTPVCTLVHEAPDATLTITHDPSLAEPYALDLEVDRPLPDGPVFALDFGGLAISTDRHRLSPDRRTLGVTDRGFGNVLRGLEAGTGVRALIGDAAIPFPTDDAAAAVAAFRACPAATLS